MNAGAMNAGATMKLVFENADFAIIDKECGWLSVPSRIGEKETRPIAGIALEKQLGTRIFPVHRLDAEVSGLLVFAKTADAHREANQVFEQHLLQKEYRAWTPGPALALGETQRWECRIAKGKKRAFEALHGKDALTEAICLEESTRGGAAYLQWRLFPKTGRSHQLRYEMYRHERPIIGDVLYGSAIKPAREGLALRAVNLDFTAAHARGLLKTLPPRIEIEAWGLEVWI